VKKAIVIRGGIPSDWPAVRALLSGAGLPIDDLDDLSLIQFIVATENSGAISRIVGAIAVQAFGDVGLLRSLVVAPSARSTGCGSRLLGAAEVRAANAGIAELWLLTIDADRFFSLRGYRPAGRDAAPLPIRETEEFRSLCPGSAVLMFRSIQQAAG
jgi:amino-acid N-acetyltransferase